MRGEWNYAVLPAPRPGPDPEPARRPGPDPALLAALAGLAGIADSGSTARRRRRALGRPPASSGCTWTAAPPAARPAAAAPDGCPFEAIVTAAACRQRLGMPCRLLGELLGAHETTISLAARRMIPLLEEHGITPHHGGTRISTPGQLREHASAAGITLTIATP